jgi:hypothetical protein
MHTQPRETDKLWSSNAAEKEVQWVGAKWDSDEGRDYEMHQR